MADKRYGRKALGVALAIVVLGALTMPVAGAAVSVGVSAKCDPDGHCVSGEAAAVNGGSSSLVELSIQPDGVGGAVAVCKGQSNGSMLLEITCSHGRLEETMSFPGSAGAVPLQTTNARLERQPVCWLVTGYFPVILGAQHVVDTDGCSQLAV